MTSRVRTKDNRTNVSGFIKQDTYSKPGGCLTTASWANTYSGASSKSVGKYIVMNDSVVKDFRKRSARGEIIMSPMTKQSIEYTSGYGNDWGEVQAKAVQCTPPNTYQSAYRMRTEGVSSGRAFGINPTVGVNPDGSVTIMPRIISAGEISSLLAEASTQCRAKRGTSASNQYETIAELNKSLTILEQATSNMQKIFARKARIFKRAREAGSMYLLYRYGITPVIQSVDAAMEGVTKAIGNVRATSRGFASLNRTSTTTLSNSQFGAFTTTWDVTNFETVDVRATWIDEYEATLGSNVGFTTKGLISLPWEFIPYSFVVDWFVNVGDYLQSIIPAVGLKSLGSCYTISTKQIVTVKAKNTSLLDPTNYNLIRIPSAAGFSIYLEEYSRTSGVPAPEIALRSNFRLSSLTRCLDSVSLIAQRIR